MGPKNAALMVLVCEEFEVTPAQLRSKVKKQRFCEARRVFSYIMRIKARYSFPRIARMLNKDHSSIIEQVERMEDHIFMRDHVATALKRIEDELVTKQIL